MTFAGLMLVLHHLIVVFAHDAEAGIEHGIVYHEPGRFGGWPANHGIWSWGDEIVVGFTLGYYREDPNGGHAIDRERPSVARQARSLDGGRSWSIEKPSYLDAGDQEPEPTDCPGGIDFTQPDFALQLRGGRFCYSLDRCRTLSGPFRMPDFGRQALLARTDYLVDGRHELTAFLAAAKDDGQEGWPLCARTSDGGKTWQLVGWIGPQPGPRGYAIMPSTLRLSDCTLLSMIRRRGVSDGTSRWWIEPYLSPDNGRSWYLLKEPHIDNRGNPPHMIWLRDGRIALTYGHRGEPYGIRARLSTDRGLSWQPERILRADGASWDLGYPRTVQRPDGQCVTVYYYHHPGQPERYIGYTIWNPGP